MGGWIAVEPDDNSEEKRDPLFHIQREFVAFTDSGSNSTLSVNIQNRSGKVMAFDSTGNPVVYTVSSVGTSCGAIYLAPERQGRRRSKTLLTISKLIVRLSDVLRLISARLNRMA